MPHLTPSRHFNYQEMRYKRRSRLRKFRAAWRDTWVLIREFRETLLLFLLILISGALTFQFLWNRSQDVPIKFIEAFYNVLTMAFFQPVISFPEEWYLDMYFFIMPLLGLVALTRGMADFGTLFFNRHLRQNQWEEAVASTFNNHIIVVGLGHVGLRVVRELIILDEEVVVVEHDPKPDRMAELKDLDIPILTGDGRSAEMLRKAGIDRASALIICTNNDLMNLQIAARIRELNEDIRVVMRMFDDQFALTMADRFKVDAVMSSSGLSAPAFAGAAAGTGIIQTFAVENQTLVMGRLEVQPGSRLAGMRVGDLEDQLDLSIVLHHTHAGIDLHPEQDLPLQVKDIIAVVTDLPTLKELASKWNRPNRS